LKTRLVCVLAGALVAAWPAATPVRAASPCAAPGYSYAGLSGAKGPHGVAATLTALEAPVVEHGHVAAWIGVGGRYEGPGGADEWLQVGLNSGRGSGNTLYYEYTRPGDPIRYVEVARGLPVGRAVRVMVLQMARKADTWRVWVDGRPVGEPIVLPGSDGMLTPLATAENWDGGAAACNRYSYRFDGLRVAHAAGGVWRPFPTASLRQDAGNRAVQSANGVLVAASGDAAVDETPAAAAPASADVAVATAVQGHRLDTEAP
jgi:hypothetical protein